MIKKTLTTLAIAGAILIAGASAANAYTIGGPLTATDDTIAPGVAVTLTQTGIDGKYEGQNATFTVVAGPDGASLASIVFAASGASTPKSIASGRASAQFSSSTEGDFTVEVRAADGALLGSKNISVSAAFADGASGSADPSTGLPVTGGEVPLTAIWIGAGALGLGGIAAVAATARRRAQASR